jgi:hypothetical protein
MRKFADAKKSKSANQQSAISHQPSAFSANAQIRKFANKQSAISHQLPLQMRK